MATATKVIPNADQVQLIIRGLKSLSDVSKRAAKAADNPAIALIHNKEVNEISILVNMITSGSLEL